MRIGGSVTGHRVLLGLALAIVGCAPGEDSGNSLPEPASGSIEPLIPHPLTEKEVAHALQLSPLPPPPADPTNRVADDPAAALLGQRLFFDERLSRDGNTSCATCHDPGQEWTDGRQLAEGILPLDRHTMSLWNVAHQRWMFWDGRADSLWAQALIPFESPLEHAFSRLELAHVVATDDTLRREYEAIFGPLPELEDSDRFPPVGRPVPQDDHAHELARAHAARESTARGHTHGENSNFYHPHQRAWDEMSPDDQRAVTEVFVNLGKAVAAYERRIVTGPAPFDVFVQGLLERDEEKVAALGESARRGLQLFLGRAQCFNCHDGPLFSDREFHGLGLPSLSDGEPDPGRTRGREKVRTSTFNGVGEWSDDPDGPARFKIDLLPVHVHGGPEFRTPSLRNVSVTAPYMHQGQLATLEDVVRFYSTLEGASARRESILQPLDLSDEEVNDLVAFLDSLTGYPLRPELMRPIPEDR